MTTPAGLAPAIAELRGWLGDRLGTGASVRAQHGRGEAWPETLPPDAVCWPLSTEEVSRILGTCARHRVPVIPFGAGTSLEGHVTAPHGGVCMALNRMDRIIEVRHEDGDCDVEPGVTREALNAHLRDTGLFFPVDPGANASLGGMAATRASGTTTIRYGGMNQNVLALEAVLADGRILRAGSRARKSSAGYDLVRLLLGSEGTLAVITRLTLRLHPRPEAVGAATCSFPDLQAAVDTVTVLVQSGAPLARIEFLDAEAVRACNKASGMGLAERPTLFLEFHGTEGSVAEQSARAQDAAHEQGGEHFRYATLAEERTALWKARHSLYFSSLALRPGCECVVADVCVPISHLAASVGETRRDLDEAGLLAPMLGHVGDGNYHVLFLLDPASTEEQARAARVYDRMIDRAQRVGGSCTGEHGIGLGKREKLVAEAGLEGIAMMRAIKDSWDPLGILNPGKILLP